MTSQRPRPVNERRICTDIQTASASIAGGQTQLSADMAESAGEKTRRPVPTTVIATAGTAVQRWGCLVIRVERTCIIAQPRPKASSVDPVMTLSVAPGKTTRVRRRAVIAPVANEAAITRTTGPDVGRGSASVCSRCCVVVESMLMAVSLSQWDRWLLRSSVAGIGVAHPGQMTGMREEVVLGQVDLAELTPGRDTGLGEDVAQVEGDRSG